MSRNHKILVLGSTGMLGFAVHRILADKGWKVTGTIRSPQAPAWPCCRDLSYLGSFNAHDPHRVAEVLADFSPSCVINCIALKGLDECRLEELVRINALFPRQLAQICTDVSSHLVHFSTDGVFDGRAGGYEESSLPSPTDAYGLSKAVGDLSGPRALTIRTSLIGRSFNRAGGLLDWFLAHAGDEISGYTRALFTGVAVTEVAFFLDSLLARPGPLPAGVFHLAGKPISKFDLLDVLKQTWKIGEGILVKDDEPVINRTLTTSRQEILGDFRVAPWPAMAQALHQFYERQGPPWNLSGDVC